MKQRLYYLDHLRVLLTVLVIWHHTSITYGASGGWYYLEEPRDNPTLTDMLLSMFTGFNQAYFMGFFFLIAGYFTPGAYDRKGAGRFLSDRFTRLGVPLLIYLTVIAPCLIYSLVFAGQMSLWTFYTERFFAFKELDLGPLWFAEALLIFALLYTAIRRVGRSSKWVAQPRSFPSDRNIAYAALGVGGAAFLLRLVFPTGTDVLGLQLGYFASYVLLFIVGVLAYRNGWLEQLTPAVARRWLRMGLIVFPVLPVAAVLKLGDFDGGMNIAALIYAFWEPFVGFGMIMWLLVRFRERYNRSSRLSQWLSDHAFTVYIIHPPVVVGYSFLIKQATWPPVFKLVVVGVLATMSCYALATAIRAVPGFKRVL